MRCWHLSKIGLMNKEVGHYDLILLQILLILIILKIKVQLMLYTKFYQIYQVVQEEKLILVV